MRITKKTILAIGLIASSLTLNSCDDNDNNEVLQRPTALVTVYPSAPDGFFMQLDESTSLVPTNMKASPFGDKNVRALVNYTIEKRSYGGNQQSVYVNWIDSIRTKQPVMTQGSEEKMRKHLEMTLLKLSVIGFLLPRTDMLRSVYAHCGEELASMSLIL